MLAIEPSALRQVAIVRVRGDIASHGVNGCAELRVVKCEQQDWAAVEFSGVRQERAAIVDSQ